MALCVAHPGGDLGRRRHVGNAISSAGREKRNRPLVDAPYNLLKIIKSQKNRCILLITYKTILQQSLDFLRANQAWPIYLFTSSPPFAADIYTFLLKFILDKLLNVPFTS